MEVFGQRKATVKGLSGMTVAMNVFGTTIRMKSNGNDVGPYTAFLELLKPGGTVVGASTALEGKKVVGLYFSALGYNRYEFRLLHHLMMVNLETKF